jgi:hypothetical protein
MKKSISTLTKSVRAINNEDTIGEALGGLINDWISRGASGLLKALNPLNMVKSIFGKRKNKKIKKEKNPYHSKTSSTTSVPVKKGDSATDILTKTYIALRNSRAYDLKQGKLDKIYRKQLNEQNEDYFNQVMEILTTNNKSVAKQKDNKKTSSMLKYGILGAIGLAAFVVPKEAWASIDVNKYLPESSFFDKDNIKNKFSFENQRKRLEKVTVGIDKGMEASKDIISYSQKINAFVTDLIKSTIDMLPDSVKDIGKDILASLNETAEDYIPGYKEIEESITDLGDFKKNFETEYSRYVSPQAPVSGSDRSNKTYTKEETATAPTNVEGVTKLLEKGESKSYDQLVIGKGGDQTGKFNAKPLTEMSVSEIRDLQSKMIRSGKFPSSAVGKYQIIGGTLQEAIDKGIVSPTDKFDQTTQDKIFKQYLIGSKRKAISNYISGSGSLENAQIELAMEFASVGVPRDIKAGEFRRGVPARDLKKGDSFYKGDKAGNKANITPEQSAYALNYDRVAELKTKAGGLDRNLAASKTPTYSEIRPTAPISVSATDESFRNIKLSKVQAQSQSIIAVNNNVVNVNNPAQILSMSVGDMGKQVSAAFAKQYGS